MRPTSTAKIPPWCSSTQPSLQNGRTNADFLPLALLYGIKQQDKCEKYALSFFATLEQGMVRWESLVERLGDRLGDVDAGLAAAVDRYGDHLGKVDLGPDDGLLDEPNPRTGHVSLHEAEGVSLAGRVAVYHTLIVQPPQEPDHAS